MTNYRDRVISSADLLARCEAHDTTDTALWGLHIRAAAVTLLVGETSAGTTVLLHNLAYHLSGGYTFLGVRPSKPLRVLYVDYESYPEIITEHLHAIGLTRNWDFLDVYKDGRELRGEALLTTLVSVGKGYDVIIIDPIMEAYPVKDEVDNAAADEQMRKFRMVARETNAGVVVVHNSGLRGHKKPGEKFLLRGATARLDRADVGINYTSTGPTTRQLRVVKSRGPNLGQVIDLKFIGVLGYQVTKMSKSRETDRDERVAQLVAAHPDMPLAELYETQIKTLGLSRATFYRILQRRSQLEEPSVSTLPAAESPILTLGECLVPPLPES